MYAYDPPYISYIYLNEFRFLFSDESMVKLTNWT